MEEKKDIIKIDFAEVAKTLWSKKKLFFKVWGVTFVLACLWIFPQPRYYRSQISIAPENTAASGGSIASLASNFGFDISDMTGSDAIYPQLYPEVLGSTQFIVELFDIKVKTLKGDVETDYYTYLLKHQKESFWNYPKNQFAQLMEKLFPPKQPKIAPAPGGKRFNPFQLSKKTHDIVALVGDNISTTYSKKTEVVTLTVKDQDPLVCALLADSIMNRLQQYITDYRTKKARIDYEHYKQLTATAKHNYEMARNRYGRFADSNEGLVLESVRGKLEDLENDMQLKYNIYTAMNTRLEAAQAKVQEKTPAFTTLQNATVPVKPAGPKRMLFVLAMLFLATIGTAFFIYRKNIISELTEAKAS